MNERKLLLVIDMQNDFITGSLGSQQAQKIVPNVQAKIKEYEENKNCYYFTKDTHRTFTEYQASQEGQRLPVAHCIHGTHGHKIIDELNSRPDRELTKTTFGSIDIAEYINKPLETHDINTIELCGVCTDICVVSNALILKSRFPEKRIIVDASCCAGVTLKSHNAALLVMEMCQIDIINKEDENVCN